MIQIKDLEEKRLIIAEFKCRSKKNAKYTFGWKSIYFNWGLWWVNDCPRDKHNRPINSGILEHPPKKGINATILEKNAEFLEFLQSVSLWINENYNKKITRSENQKRFEKMLADVRADNLDTLLQALKDNGLSEDGYLITEVSCDDCKLATYALFNKNTLNIKIGTYETILDRIINIVRNEK